MVVAQDVIMTVANCHRGVAFRQETHAFKMRIVAGTNVPTPLVNLNTPLPAARHSNGGSEKLEEGRQSEQNTSICSGCPVTVAEAQRQADPDGYEN